MLNRENIYIRHTFLRKLFIESYTDFSDFGLYDDSFYIVLLLQLQLMDSLHVSVLVRHGHRLCETTEVGNSREIKPTIFD